VSESPVPESETPEPEPIDVGQIDRIPSQDPVMTIDPETEQVSIAWPGGRPESVMITSDMLEEWIRDRNQMIEFIARQREKIKRMRDVLSIIRLGRRPNRADWASVNMITMPKKTQVDVMRRARRRTASS
jgi:hypothetical protein